MPPFMVGYINEFVLIHHHPDMKTDNQFQFFQCGFGARLHRFQMRKKIIGHFKTNGLQDFRLRLNMVVQAGRLHAYVFGQVPHGCRTKALFPEKLGCFFDDGIFFTAVFFAPDFCHPGRKDRQLSSCRDWAEGMVLR